MPHDLVFLRSALSGDPMNMGFRWSLQVVKLDAPLQSAYVAFGSTQLAQKFIEAIPCGEAVKIEELDETHFTDFERRPLVLLKTEDDVRRLVEDRTNFPYGAHLFTYRPGQGLDNYAV